MQVAMQTAYRNAESDNPEFPRDLREYLSGKSLYITE